MGKGREAMKTLCRAASFAAILVVLAAAVATAGEIRYSQFAAIVNPSGSVVSDPAGTNNGWNPNPAGGPGVFIEYPVQSGPPWWNQWFYNDPLDLKRWKWIDYDIVITPTNPAGDPDIVEVAINWTTPLYPSNPEAPPLTDPNFTYIERYTIFQGPVVDSIRLTRGGQGPIIIPDYNPEWVSIDIRQINAGNVGDVIGVSGMIRHQCVPEPATLVLLVLGSLTLVLARRR
jgi:hypothetical protein